MVIDISAWLAILFDEAERRAYNEAIEDAVSRLMSVATFVEVSIVVESRFGAEGLRDLDLFIDHAGIEIVEVDAEQGQSGAPSLQPVRQGPASGRPELRRLLCIRTRRRPGRIATVQGDRLFSDGRLIVHFSLIKQIR